MKIYVSSKVKHALMWKGYRNQGFDIISTWIDEAEPGQSNDYADLAKRCIDEIKECDILLLYCEEGEILKGALIEVGAALALNKIVFCVGYCESLPPVFKYYSQWRDISDLETLFEILSGLDTAFDKLTE